MKIPNPMQHLKRLTLALATAVGFGAGIAQAAPPVADFARWFDASGLSLADGAAVTQWNDGSANGANATVPGGNATPVFVANSGTESGFGAIHFPGNGGAGSSAALAFSRDSSIRTIFSVFKGSSFLLTDASNYDFHRPSDGTPSDPLWAGYASGNIRGGSTYVNGALVDGTTFSMPTNLHNGFNLVEVITSGNVAADSFNKDRVYHAGDQYQAEVIIYDRALSGAERIQVEDYLMNKWFAVPILPQAMILDFGPGAAVAPVTSHAANITWTVPYGTNLATLAPVFTLSSGATCTVGGSAAHSGDPHNFTNPVQFTVKSSDSLITNVYTVTVSAFGSGTPSGEMNLFTYDNSDGTYLLAPISNLLAVVPSATGTQTTNINYGSFAGVLPGITSDDSLAVVWEGWLDVTKSGHGDYTFGTASDDGSVVYVDLNNDGVFDPATEMVVNNNYVQPTVVRTGTVTLNVDSVHVIIGYFESGGGQSMEARFAKGTGVAWETMQNVIGAGPYFSLNDPFNRPQANILSFGPGALVSPVAGNAATIAWTVSHGTDVTALAPTFTLPPGATCNRVSGAPYNFTNPVTYVVTSSDSHVTNTYTVTVRVLPPGPAGVDFGLAVWLKADAIDTGDSSQVRTNGSNLFVQQWKDFAGYSQNAANADTTTQPQYLAGDLNGLPSVKWDGTGKFLQGPSATTIKTVFAVCKKDAEATGLDGMFCQSHNADSQNIRGNGLNWNQSGYQSDGNDFADGGQVYVNGTSGHVHNGQWHVLMEESASLPSFTYQLGQQGNNRFFNGRIAEFIIYDRELTSTEQTAVGSYLAFKYRLDTAYVNVPQAKMASFGLGASISALSGHDATIHWAVPNGTDASRLAPTFAMSAGATCTVDGITAVSGETRNFTNPVVFVVTSSDSAVTNTYTVTVRVLPPGPPVTGYARWFDASALSLADADPVTLWSDFSGHGADATVPGGNATPVFVANSGTETGLGAIYLAGNGGAGSSGALMFTEDSAIRTVFSVFKGDSFLLTDQNAYHFHRGEGGSTDGDPATALWGNDASGNVTNGRTYVNGLLQNYPTLINSSGTMPTNVHNGFNLVEVVTTGTVQADSFNKDRGTTHAGNQYQAEVIIYDRVLTELERVEVEHYLMTKWFAVDFSAQILSLDAPGASSVIDPVAMTIALTVPYGTNLATLAPTVTLTSGTCSPTSGTAPSPSFAVQNPAIYTVTDAAKGITNQYTVTVNVTPAATGLTMSNVIAPGCGYAWPVDPSGLNLEMVVPRGASLSAVAPTFSLSPFATCNPPSGTLRNFTSPQTYTVTAQDGTTQEYTLTLRQITTVATGYQALVLASAPISYWPLNETSGTTAVDMASGLNNITYGGTYTLGDVSLRNDGNTSVLFTSATTAAGGNTGVAYNNSLNPSQFTVEFWYKHLNATTAQYLVSLQDRSGTPAANRLGYAFQQHNAATRFQFTYGKPGNNNGTLTSSTDLVLGSVYHVVATYDGTNMSMYVNGVLNTTIVDTYVPATPTQPGFTIGSRNGNTSAPSNIQDVALYSRALSAAEILSHYTGAPATLSYADWATAHGIGGQAASADADHDGMSNFQEYAFGLNPTSGKSVNPISVPFNKTTGTFSYTRTANTGLTYTVWHSADLVTWTSTGATQGTAVANGGDVETVPVTLDAGLLSAPKLFVRVQAQ